MNNDGRTDELLAAIKALREENESLRIAAPPTTFGADRGRGRGARPLSFYFAGKIHKNCWRHGIVKHLREVQMPHDDGFCFNSGECPSGGGVNLPDQWPVLRKAVFGEHDYVGPFFQSCDHGCFHGDSSHGTAAQDPGADKSLHGAPVSSDVIGLCLDAVRRCDVVFAYIDKPDCYGTVTEIGYAAALGKEVWVCGPARFPDMWFVYCVADVTKFSRRPSPERFLRGFLRMRKRLSR